MTPRHSGLTNPLDRRTFLKAGALGVGALGAEPSARIEAAAEADVPAPGAEYRTGPLIDVNVTLSHWPFRRLPGDETPDLVAELRRNDVVSAWAGSFDALLHRDIGGVNARLAAECRKHGPGLLVPFGAVNPELPDWEDDVRRCHDEHGMPGIRLFPNYHGYALDAPEFARLLDLAEARGLVVQIAVMMEDERTQHPLVRVPQVDVAPMVAHARRLPRLQIVLLDAFRFLRADLLAKLAALDNVAFDIGTIELVGGIAGMIDKVPVERLLFGSDAPYYYFESAVFKLKESALEGETLRAIASGNARRILGTTR